MLEMPTITTWYRCPRGHVLPFAFGFVQTGAGQEVRTGNLCTQCLFEAMRAAFPTDPCPSPEDAEDIAAARRALEDPGPLTPWREAVAELGIDPDTLDEDDESE